MQPPATHHPASSQIWWGFVTSNCCVTSKSHTGPQAQILSPSSLSPFAIHQKLTLKYCGIAPPTVLRTTWQSIEAVQYSALQLIFTADSHLWWQNGSRSNQLFSQGQEGTNYHCTNGPSCLLHMNDKLLDPASKKQCDKEIHLVARSRFGQILIFVLTVLPSPA